ncbi:MAG TPA: carboxylesterase family protein, partial [Nevskiaceae bacterium]|nr:carboxylesterase family protein [Nevskiaceae bacterium]
VAALAVQDGLAADAQAAQRLLAGKDRAWIAQYLRGRSAAQIMRLPYDQPDLRKKAAGGWNDGQVVAVDARAAFEQGQLAPIPMMIGTTRDEAKLLAGVYRISPAEMFNLMLHSDPDARPTVRTSDIIAPYMLPSLGSWLYDHYTAAITWALKRGVNQSIAAVAAHDPQVWVYRFDWDRAPEPWHTVYGAAHGIDLPFVFGNFSTGFFAMDFSRANRPGREALSQLMMQSIGAFMRTGDPNTPQLPLRWQQWGGAGKSHAQMIFDASDELPQLTIE